ncbi:MAG: LPS-assembly protein LptD [Alphaproteobacteria bacterium]|nr:LPS-assembly protein LptD [Alphaproteobacteria bacterium]
MRIEYKIFHLCAFCAMFCSFSAYAVTEAGEVRHKEEKHPSASMYVTNNIVDFSNIHNADSSENTEEPIDFSADEMTNDDEAKIITATGNVEILYSGMRLLTDKLVYDENADTITAIGNVKLYSSDGAVVRGDKVVLSENMSIGDMNNIKALLKDESFVTAKFFRKKNNHTKVMRHATYTACDICEGKSPLWQVKAKKVQHQEDSQNVYYNHAFIYVKGVPVFYTPFMTHPDPSVKRRSGLLAPTLGSSNFLDAYFQPRYFWAVDDHTNVLLSPIFSSKQNTVWSGEFSHYFYNSYTSFGGSYLKDKKQNRRVPQNRGNFIARGRYDINNNWRMSYDWRYVSDYVYLKDLGLANQDDAWLNSNIKFERFSGKDYISVDAYYYKILSYNLHRRNVQQYYALDSRKPIVAPLVDAEFYSDPLIWGSHFRNELNTASIYHKNGSETQRVTSINAWELPYTSPFGEKYRFVASLKSDIYYINRYAYSDEDTYTGTTARVFPQVGVEWRLPFVRATESSRQIIEPVVVAVAAPNGGNKDDKIPNEDSEDVYFDDTNVLDLDRYVGYDRNDTGSRVSYGFRWNSYGNIFGKTSAFIAQSLEQNERSSFLRGLEAEQKSHFSDFVGRINASPNQYLDLNYRFRLDRKTLNAEYSELGVNVGPSFLKFNASYIFLEGNTHYYDLYSERKELYTSIKVDVSEHWAFSLYNLKDLTKKRRGRLEHGGSVVYEDECFKWDLSFKKYNTSNPNLDNDYEYGMTFYLKTIGSFGS